MLRMITLAGLVVALTAGSAAFAQPPSGYGTEGPNGERLDDQAQTTFDRHWNANNEPQYRAESSARWLRQHGQGLPNPF